MKYAEHISELVGNTPLVRLRSITEGLTCRVLAKVEYLNPGGSSKDRIAGRVIEAAEKASLLKPGGTIIEATSGNTGVGLALIASLKGYRCIFVCPDKVSPDKINTLRAYGAEVVVTPTDVAPDHPESYYSVSDRLARDIPGAWKVNQYENLNGPRAHYETTGPEIWRDTAGRVTHFVAGVGTGGTITGVGRFLREQSQLRTCDPVRVIAADPVGSVFSGSAPRPYLVEGVGEDFWPGAFDPSVVDDVITVSDARAFRMTQRLAEEEGLLVGGSSGMAVSAALEVAQTASPDSVIVVLLPDGGRGYLSKIFDREWRQTHGFEDSSQKARVESVLSSKPYASDQIFYVHASDTVGEAVRRMVADGVSQLAVLAQDPPVNSCEVVGSVSERSLMRALSSAQINMETRVSDVLDESFPFIGIGESVDKLVATLDVSDAVVVLDGGLVKGLLTRSDIVSANWAPGRESVPGLAWRDGTGGPKLPQSRVPQAAFVAH